MPSPSTSSTRRDGTTRRAVLGGTLGLLGATASACSSGGGAAPGSAAGSPSTASSDPSSSSTASADADRRLVALARRDLSLAHAVAARQARLSPSLRVDLTSFARLHARHAASLGGLVAVSRRDLVGVRSTTAEGLRDAEQGLERRLTALAVAASSGPLAGRLASMAAAVAQRVSLL